MLNQYKRIDEYRGLNDRTDIIKFHLGDAYRKFVLTIQVQYLGQQKKD